ncbi:MAG: PAS domain-containing protein [Nitrosarchaeum sp.]|nr:PAS domain-containing protein [Nitrosarchaeum sp.]
MDKNNLTITIYVLIGVLIFSIALLTYLDDLINKSKIIETKKKINDLAIQNELKSHKTTINLAIDSIQNFYENSETVTPIENDKFMQNILNNIPMIKNILIINGSKIFHSYPMHTFEGFDIIEIIPNLTTITHPDEDVLLVFPLLNGTQIIFVLPDSFLSLEYIIPENTYNFSINDLNSEIMYSASVTNRISNLDDSVYKHTEVLIGKANTGLINFKTNKPIILEYAVSYNPLEESESITDILFLVGGCSFSILIPLLLIRANSKSNSLKNKSQELNKSNEILIKTQSLLLKSEEEFRNFFQLAPYPMCVITKEGIIRKINESFENIFQFSPHDIFGKSIFEVNPDESVIMQKYLETWKKNGSLNNEEMIGTKKDGTKIPLLVSIGSSMNSSGNPSDGIVILIDQTKAILAKKLKEENQILLENQIETLKLIDTQKNEFTSMISHEIKTPVFPIKFHSKLLQDHKYGQLNEKQLESVNQIYQNAEHLELLLNDLLDIQKINIGTMKYHYEEIQLEKLMDAVYNESIIYMNEKNISFINITNDKLTFKSDFIRIKQIFTNLIKNSVDFVHDKGGKIEIGASKENNFILFYVKDNGIGMDKENQSNLFKKFYQGDTSMTRKHGGTGLGLVICKGLAEGLGGKMYVESELNKGATFYFSIPLAN